VVDSAALNFIAHSLSARSATSSPVVIDPFKIAAWMKTCSVQLKKESIADIAIHSAFLRISNAGKDMLLLVGPCSVTTRSSERLSASAIFVLYSEMKYSNLP
jgi:hypothetical protein